MLIDTRLLQLETIEADICIIGAGPAGISLAREFIGHKLAVALLESGGSDFDPQIQTLADGLVHGDPRLGVVDADCRVHGIHNLFVAGSSTFPTGGYANPTLTIVAMALRLGDLLKQEFTAGGLPGA